MSESPSTDAASSVAERWFTTTHWSVVLAAGHSAHPDAQEALEGLCRAYWYPLYAYIRRRGQSPEEAQDLTQEFFARFLEKKYLRRADPTRGQFRAFLLTALKHFLANEWKKAHRQKRGSGLPVLSIDAAVAEQRYAAEPVEETNPETIYERRWAATLLDGVLRMLQQEWIAAGKDGLFEDLKSSLWGGSCPTSYAEIARRRGSTETAIKMAAYRLRQRYRELLRAAIANTVSCPAEVDGELRHLIAVISGG
jgi:RNA polymerase sigma-70 factor (ECF subfamily)